jgi:serine O-acetyltransferase
MGQPSTPAERWRADRARYPPHAWVREQSLWSVAVLRFGDWAGELDSAPARWLASRAYWLAYRVVQTLTGIGMPRGVQVGGGLRIHHFGGIFIESGVRIGERCTLRQGVTLGERVEGGPVPVLGDDVELGAYAQVLGGVTIGDGARVGAMSVVLHDVAPGQTVVGIPARPAREA